MGANHTNNTYDVITDKRAIPYASNGTGTIITTGIAITGTGTSFLSELPAGSWIVDLTQDELRKVVRVDSDTVAILDYAFTSDLSSQTPSIIAKKDTSVTEVSIIIPLVDEAGTSYTFGKINNKTFPSGLPFELSKAGRDDSDTQDFIDPVIVDATGTLMCVITLK